MASVNGKDSCGNESYISVTKENGKIHIFSPEDAGDVVFTTKQARELVKIIEKCIKEQCKRFLNHSKKGGDVSMDRCPY